MRSSESQDSNDQEVPSNGGRRELALLLLVFLLLSMIFTRDVIVFIADGVPCGAGDSVMFAWNFWWVAEQLKHGELFFKCDYAMLPFGVRTVYHTAIPLHCVVLAPITWLFGPIVSSNLNLILSFALGGFGMALLVRFLTGSLLAGLCGGIVFAFSTTHWYHAVGHYNLTATELLPFCLLFLLKWAQEQGAANLAAASGLLALNLYNDYTTTIILGLCALPIFVLGLVRTLRRGGPKRALLSIAASSLVFGLIAFPVDYYAHEFSSLFDTNWGREPELAASSSPDLLSYLVPDAHSWYATQGLQRGWLADLTAGGLDRQQFFGIFALILSLFGARYLSKRELALLLCLAAGLLVCLGVSLGPEPRIGEAQFIPSVLSPFNALTSVPFLDGLRIPGRFGLGVMLTGAILVGIGSAWVLSKARGKEMMAVLLVLVAGLLFAEKVHKPIATGGIEIPSVYRALAALFPKPGGIVITPFHVWSGQGMTGSFPFVDPTIALFCQSVHDTPMINGFAARIPKEIASYYRQAPLTSSLMALQTGQGVDVGQILAEKDYVEQITYLFGVSHIVCDYAAEYIGSGLPMKRYIEEVLQGKMVYGDDTGRIYRLPFPEAPPHELSITPEDASARLYLMEGWHKPVIHEGRKRLVFDPCSPVGETSRHPRIRVLFRTSEAANRLRYSCQLSPISPEAFKPTHFRIDLDGKTVMDGEATAREGFSIQGVIDADIEPGLHYLTLTPSSDGSPETPSQPSGLSRQAMFIEKIELNW